MRKCSFSLDWGLKHREKDVFTNEATQCGRTLIQWYISHIYTHNTRWTVTTTPAGFSCFISEILNHLVALTCSVTLNSWWFKLVLNLTVSHIYCAWSYISSYIWYVLMNDVFIDWLSVLFLFDCIDCWRLFKDKELWYIFSSCSFPLILIAALLCMKCFICLSRFSRVRTAGAN